VTDERKTYEDHVREQMSTSKGILTALMANLPGNLVLEGNEVAEVLADGTLRVPEADWYECVKDTMMYSLLKCREHFMATADRPDWLKVRQPGMPREGD